MYLLYPPPPSTYHSESGILHSRILVTAFINFKYQVKTMISVYQRPHSA